MNREIKFRAWDLTARMMRDDGYHPQGKPHMKFDVGVLGMHVKSSWTSGIDGLNIRPDFNEFILMQFTGLKDKNGKEIYEGDIVKCFEEQLPGGLVYGIKNTVSFYEGAFGYWLKSAKDFVSFECNINFKWSDCRSELIEVIGNLYEHPHLLTQDTSPVVK